MYIPDRSGRLPRSSGPKGHIPRLGATRIRTRRRKGDARRTVPVVGLKRPDRARVFGAEGSFYREMPGAKDLDIDSVKKDDKDEIVRKMVVLAKNTPGTIGSAY